MEEVAYHIRVFDRAIEHLGRLRAQCRQLASFPTELKVDDDKQCLEQQKIDEGQQQAGKKNTAVANDPEGDAAVAPVVIAPISQLHARPADDLWVPKSADPDSDHRPPSEAPSSSDKVSAPVKGCMGEVQSPARGSKSGRDARSMEEQRPRKRRRSTQLSSDSATTSSSEPPKMFTGICALFVEGRERSARIKVWKEKLQRFGGVVFDLKKQRSENLTHVLAASMDAVRELSPEHFKLLSERENLCYLSYQWIQECLMAGSLVCQRTYELRIAQAQEAPPAASPPSKADTTEAEEDVHTGTEAGEDVHTGQEDAQMEVEDDASGSDDEREGVTLEAKRMQRRSFYGKQEAPNLNNHITDILSDMWHIMEDVLDDGFRAIAYRKAVTKIRGLPFKVEYAHQVKELYGIGNRLLGYIGEILGTGRLQKLEELQKKPEVMTIRNLASVWGIGVVQAKEFFKKGCRNVEDLQKEPSLSAMARIGLKYYDDIQKRIPREEVADVEKYVRECVEGLRPGSWVNATGSYRRGSAACGDIDILITHPDELSHHGLLGDLLEKLRGSGFVVEGPSVDTKISKGGGHPDTFMGICRVREGPFRRIDMKVYPRHVYAFALLAFTGNDVLNRKLRYKARLLGYKLSDQGLFVRESKKKDARASTEIVPCPTEEDIFEKLGVEYCPPHERNW